MLLMQFHPFFVNPGAHKSQLFGDSKHEAHCGAHLVHLADKPVPDKMYPGLH